MALSSLFKLFFPSWRFFEEIGAAPQLHYRFSNPQSTWSGWVRWQPQQRRRLTELFLNATGNLYLAYYTMIERLIQDSNEWQKKDPSLFVDSVSYKLVEQLVRLHLRQHAPEAGHFQFKVGTATEDALISLEHEV